LDKKNLLIIDILKIDILKINNNFLDKKEIIDTEIKEIEIEGLYIIIKLINDAKQFNYNFIDYKNIFNEYINIIELIIKNKNIESPDIRYSTFEIPDFILYEHSDHTNYTIDGIKINRGSTISKNIVCFNMNISKLAYENEYYENKYNLISYCVNDNYYGINTALALTTGIPNCGVTIT
jgi:hypothetical protein